MALNVIATITLDMLHPYASSSIVQVNQYDTAGVIRAQLLNDGSSWQVPQEAKPVVMFKKTDNIGGFYDVTELNPSTAAVTVDSNDRSIIYIALDQQTTTTATITGQYVNMQVTFYENRARLSTFAFYMQVQPSVVTSGDIHSNWLFNILSQEIAQVITDARTPEFMTAWLEQYIRPSIEIGAYAIDDSLTLKDYAADAKSTGRMVVVSDTNPNLNANKVWVKKTPSEIEIPTVDDIQELKSAIQSITEETGSETIEEEVTVVWADNGISPTGSNVEAETLHHTDKIPVNAGDVISTPSGAFRFITAYNGNVADASKGDSVGDLLSYTVPEGIDGVILTKYKTASSAIKKTYVLTNLSAIDSIARNNLEELSELVDAEQQEYEKTETLLLTWQSGYMDTAGVITQSSYLNYSNKIAVVPGDVISSRDQFRFVTAFSNATAISAKGDNSGANSTYTVPEGIDGVVISRYTTATGTVIKSSQVTEYVTQRKPFGIFRKTGNLANGEMLSLANQNINKKLVTVFCADIQTFSRIIVGRKTASDGYWCEVDSTNITIVKDGTRSPSVEHGLTITNNIAIRISTGTDGKSNPRNFFAMTVTLTSNGESFSTTDALWTNRSYGTPFAESDGSVLNNCVLSCQSLDMNKLIYAFGDSYFSWYPERWVYYLAEAGYADNVLTNAFAGEGSQAATESLLTLVPMGFPKYVLWCLGMNDGSDTSEAPSPTWAKGRDAVISICKEYGITPVFGTIPTVPTINNEQKNAWIRSSGYRYVDIAKAVGAQANGTWYSGMCDDGVHPTEEGAKAIFNRVIADFPEIMIQC